MKEFTGSYYRCSKCTHIWDYEDDACPYCGGKHFDDLSANDVRWHIRTSEKADKEILREMLLTHGD